MPVDIFVHQHLVNVLGPRASKLNREISPDDEMYHGLRGTYLQQGLVAFVRMKTAAQAAGVSRPRRSDHACGHGRVLKNSFGVGFSNAELTACDVAKRG